MPPSPKLPTSRLIISLLNQKSFEKNLAEYTAANRPCFALLKIGGEVIDDELDKLAETCAFLTDIGLLPAIVHGGGPQMNKELSKRGVKPQYVKGNRVTDMETLQVAKTVFTELNEKLTSALNKAGAPAKGLPIGVFKAKIASPELGFVGEVTGVEVDGVKKVLASKQIPVMTSLGSSMEHPALNINADVAARELALSIQPNRVIYTSAKGGWIDDDSKQIVPKIVMSRDYQRLSSLNYEGRQGTLLKLNEIKALLDGLSDDSAVTISSAGGRLSRIFPPNVTSSDNLSRFQNLQAEIVADPDTYSSGAIVTKSKSGKSILENFSAEGEEADALKEKLVKEFPTGLAWKVDNFKTDAMISKADGTIKAQNQTVAWYGSDWNSTSAPADVLSKSKDSDSPPASEWTSPISTTNNAKDRKRDVKVGLLGARGYVGRELVKLLATHSRLDLALASSRALVGKNVAQEFNVTSGLDPSLKFETVEGSDLETHPLSKEIDVWILALPNGLAPKWIEPLNKVGKSANKGTGALMIDLGADFRFTDEWAYGLPERKGAREKIVGKRKIANPGCYATGAQVGLMPLLQNKLVVDVPSIFGLSGYSGAGTTPSDKNNPLYLRDNIIPYSLVKHMHEREVTRHCNHRVAFMPHVAPYFQGIALTLSTHLNRDFASTKEFVEMYEDYFRGEPLIKVLADAPRVRDNMTKHHVAVGGFTWDDKNRRLALHCTIDNLLKGAATQAMQNINIALGFKEYDGIL